MPFLNALACQNKDRPPVWLMRQAGRYMPSYRKLREKHSFLEMAMTPELATEVTLLPVNELGVDAAILFSDILVILQPLGRKIDFIEGVGPLVTPPLKNGDELHVAPIKETLSYVFETIKILKKELKIPLLGFAGAPFTVASYLIGGGIDRVKAFMFSEPELFGRVIDLLTEMTIEYLTCQSEAGVDAVQLFDTWAGELSAQHFASYSLKPMEKISRALKEKGIKVILFSKKTAQYIPSLVELKPAALSFDWTVDLFKIREQVPNEIAIQGNFDPALLYCSHAVIEKEVQRVLKKMQNDAGYIVNLGHGLKPDMKPESVKIFVNTVKEFELCKVNY